LKHRAPSFEPAHAAWEAGKLRLALSLFSKCAEAGDESCMLNVGYFYDEGLATKKDKLRAMYWYKRAYRRGSGAAASNIAILYREAGRHRLSYQWFVRATLLGDGDAEVEIAKLLATGRGVRRSTKSALLALVRALRSKQITPAGKEEAASLSAALRSAA
jgi:TPR repeat protein